MATKSSSVGKVAGGIGLAALAAGAAAAYFLTGKDGKANKKIVRAWAKKAQSEVAEKIKGIEKLSKTSYEQAVKEVMAKYRDVKNIDPSELSDFGKEIKSHWNTISKQAMAIVNKKPAPAKKPVAKAKLKKK